MFSKKVSDHAERTSKLVISLKKKINCIKKSKSFSDGELRRLLLATIKVVCSNKADDFTNISLSRMSVISRVCYFLSGINNKFWRTVGFISLEMNPERKKKIIEATKVTLARNHFNFKNLTLLQWKKLQLWLEQK